MHGDGNNTPTDDMSYQSGTRYRRQDRNRETCTKVKRFEREREGELRRVDKRYNKEMKATSFTILSQETFNEIQFIHVQFSAAS